MMFFTFYLSELMSLVKIIKLKYTEKTAHLSVLIQLYIYNVMYIFMIMFVQMLILR